MAIDEKEFAIEKKRFDDTVTWIENEAEKIEKEDFELQNKVKELRKESKGRYSEELETKEKLYNITHKNFEKYIDAKSSPYFARIDFREYRRDVETFYIGKFGLGDIENGDEKVIDWRAPIADLYYSGTFGDCYYKAPKGVVSGELSLKRKFLVRDSKLKDAFDEGINEIILKSGDGNENALVDEFLRINLEESISTKLKDVVATIQKEQNEIIRADKNGALIVQGSAGSGKTTVALHRLAYLLYKFKDNMSGKDILVIAPNKLFLDYISQVLPDLGVNSVKQSTYEDIACEILGIKPKIYTKDTKLISILEGTNSEEKKYILNTSKFKGSQSFKVIIDRFIRYMEKNDADSIEDIKVDDYTLFDSKEIKRLFVKDLINLPLNSRKMEIKRYLKLKLDDKIASLLDKIDFTFEYQISRVKKTYEDTIEMRKKLIEVYDERDKKKSHILKESKKSFEDYFEKWYQINTSSLYQDFFNNQVLFNEITNNEIPKKLYDYMREKLNEDLNNGIIDCDDLVPMLYIKLKIEGVPEKYKYKHIVIDEAQDYSFFQIFVLKDIAVNNSFTIVGDIGQGIYFYKGIDNWDKILTNVFDNKGKYTILTQSYRSTIEIINFANKVLKKQNNSLKPAVPVLRHGEMPKIIEFKTNKDFCSRVDKIVDFIHSNGKKSVAVIGRTFNECKKIRDYLRKNSSFKWVLIKGTDKTLTLDNIIIPSYMTKGLEFDCSVIYNCNDDNYNENELDKKLLYVVLTRSLHYEYIFYNGNLSPLIK
ncbi:RNA polymerase recycling motor HelD [Clostridium sp. JN-9]|uniref:RNA polymerase recycling motor HelD n=1 Tax=Clostridium sp. JN-9 TaxID=2507159 RepID=UPI000FFE2216|nr:RNA polymerase recycling motor HelD [Clostridium sp. JN-9]QAT40277.1 DEAD/DEAH box helicase [Clostridium sp. JN-9]